MGKGKRSNKHKPATYFWFLKKEDSFRLECWLGEEQLEKSNCIDGTVFGGAIEGCTTGGGAVVGGSYLDCAI